MLKRRTLVLVAVLGLGFDARAGLEGDTVSVEQHFPELGTIRDSRAVVVQAGDADSVDFETQNVTTIDVDPESIHLTLGCNFAVCNRITTTAAFNGFVVAGMDWSDPPGAPVDVMIASNAFVGPARVELLPGAGSIAINLLFHAWKDRDFVDIHFVFSPQVEIDLLPRSRRNVIRSSVRRVGLAILGSEELDVRDVDVLSLRFGPDGAPPWSENRRRSPVPIVLGDVNRDERDDLSLRFDVEAAGLPPGTGEACLTGQIGGLPFVACDAVDVRP